MWIGALFLYINKVLSKIFQSLLVLTASMDKTYLNFFELYGDDTIFSAINKNFISLQDKDIKENNQHLRRILTEGLIPIMKKNALFNDIYKKIKYAGSFYKGTKVGKPNEYDLDLIVQLPLNYTSLQLETEHEHHGYVKIKVGERDKLPGWQTHSQILNKWIDEDYLDQNQFRQWMESVMAKTFEQLEKNGSDYELTVDGAEYVLRRFSKSGPAFTLHIRLKDDPVKNEMMSVDLVPSLEFTDILLKKYKAIPDMAPTFVVIPKPLDKIVINGNNLWRLSFYDQEKHIFSEKEFTKMKPIIRMLKKFRDRKNMKSISSYFIEILCLHELSRRKTDVRFFRGPLTGLFLFMLKRLSEVLDAKFLPFFWQEEHNLLPSIKKKEMENNCNQIKNILKTVEKRYVKNRFVIAEFILTAEEVKHLKLIVSPSDGNFIDAPDNPSPSTSDPKPIAIEGQSAHTSNAETANFVAKEIAHDQLMKIRNNDEPKPDESETLPSGLEGKFPPDTVEAVRDLFKDHFEKDYKSDNWVPFVRFASKVFCPPDTPIHVALTTLVDHRENRRAKAEKAKMK